MKKKKCWELPKEVSSLLETESPFLKKQKANEVDPKFIIFLNALACIWLGSLDFGVTSPFWKWSITTLYAATSFWNVFYSLTSFLIKCKIMLCIKTVTGSYKSPDHFPQNVPKEVLKTARAWVIIDVSGLTSKFPDFCGFGSKFYLYLNRIFRICQHL